MMQQTDRHARVTRSIAAERAELSAMEAAGLYRQELLRPIANLLEDATRCADSAGNATSLKGGNGWLEGAERFLLIVSEPDPARTTNAWSG
jgi:hypothetical protein